MSKPLISIQRTDLKETAKHLKRIADCFEKYLQLEYNYNMQLPKTPNSNEEEGLSVHDDLLQSAAEVEDLVHGRPPGYLGDIE